MTNEMWDDEDDFVDPSLAGGIGSLFPIGGYIVKKKIYRRPIGFLADIDKLVDEDGNERRVQKVPQQPRKNQRALKSKQGQKKAGERGQGAKGRRQGSGSQGWKPTKQFKIQFANPQPAREPR